MESTLTRLKKLPNPPSLDKKCCPGQENVTKEERIKMYLFELDKVEAASSSEEALYMVQEGIEHIEDLYSGLVREHMPSTKRTKRMYKAFEDNILRRFDGSISVITKGNRVEIDKDGSFTIIDRFTDEIWIKKPGYGR